MAKQVRYRHILPKTEAAEQQIVARTLQKLCKKSRQYKCSDCSLSFVRYINLVAHQEKHKAYSEQICRHCCHLYESAAALLVHTEALHKQTNSFICQRCKKQYKTKGYLLRHLQDVHKCREQIYTCNLCLSEFSSRETLIAHYEHIHARRDNNSSSIQPPNDDNDYEMYEEFLDEFLLNTANNRIIDNFGLSEWETLDLQLPDMLLPESTNALAITAEFAYQCPHCAANCVDEKQLLMHLRAQLAIGANRNDACSCPYCGRVRHALIKRHICQVCDRHFATMDHLRKHVLGVHHTERRHKCQYCNKRFIQRSHLQQHLAKHTTGKPHQCDIRAARFCRKIDVSRHIQLLHKQTSLKLALDSTVPNQSHPQL